RAGAWLKRTTRRPPRSSRLPILRARGARTGGSPRERRARATAARDEPARRLLRWRRPQPIGQAGGDCHRRRLDGCAPRVRSPPGGRRRGPVPREYGLKRVTRGACRPRGASHHNFSVELSDLGADFAARPRAVVGAEHRTGTVAFHRLPRFPARHGFERLLVPPQLEAQKAGEALQLGRATAEALGHTLECLARRGDAGSSNEHLGSIRTARSAWARTAAEKGAGCLGVA